MDFLYRQLFVTPKPLPSSLSLTGKTALITGANAGLGFHACLQLLERGLSRLVLGVRNVESGNQARNSLREKFPDAEILIYTVDLKDSDSVIAFAQKLNTELNTLDVAILNAGVFLMERNVNAKTGYEENLQVNCISTILLTILLLPILRKPSTARAGSPARLTLVSSEVAIWANFKARNEPKIIEAVNDEKFHDPIDQYQVSKLLGLFASKEIARKLDPDEILFNTVNPGLCNTGLRRTWKGAFKFVAGIMDRLIARTSTVGARTLVHAAVVAGRDSHGKFLSENKPFKNEGLISTPEGPALQEKLWTELLEILEKLAPVGDILQ